MLPELSPEQLADRRAQLPLRPYPLLYFSWAYLCLVVAALALAIDPRSVAGFFYHPRMLAVVHLVTLGWISSSILGALYLVLPMAFRVPLARRRIDGWIFALHVIGVLGMVSHFWIDAMSGMIWSAGTVVVGLVLATLRFLVPVAGSRVAAPVRLHLQLAFFNILVAGLLGMAVGLHRFFPFLPGGPLSGTLAHAHLSILGWATMVVMAAGYRLLPMLLPSAVPRGAGVWATAILMEIGSLTLATTLLLAPSWVWLGAMVTAAGVFAFGRQVWWMRRNPRPAPAARPHPDLGVAHAMQALVYLAAAVVLGLVLVLTPSAIWKMRAAMAYGVVFLLGFLAQIIVGVGSRILPWAAYLWGFGDGGFLETPPSPHELPVRGLQWLTLVCWTLAVPGIAFGLTFDWIAAISLGGWLLTIGVIAGAITWLLTIRRSGARFVD